MISLETGRFCLNRQGQHDWNKKSNASRLNGVLQRRQWCGSAPPDGKFGDRVSAALTLFRSSERCSTGPGPAAGAGAGRPRGPDPPRVWPVGASAAMGTRPLCSDSIK